MDTYKKVIFDDDNLRSLLIQLEYYLEKQMGGNDRFIDSISVVQQRNGMFFADVIELLEDNEVKDLASRL